MKRIIAIIALAVVVCGSTSAQKDQKVLKEADDLIAQRKYESAYNLLDQFDPTNDNSSILLKKEDIALSYFAQSIMHQMFSLVDLKEGETLDSVRVNFEQGNIFALDADSLTMRLLKKDPSNCALLQGHARYHEALLYDYDIYMWLESLEPQCLELLEKAAQGKCATGGICYQLGLYYNMQEEHTTAAKYYNQSIALCDTLWNSHYNLGTMLYFDEQYAEALPHLRRAYQGYTSTYFKADAARVTGLVYDENLENADSALYYYQKALDIDPSNIHNQVFLMKYYLKHGDPKAETLLQSGWRVALEGEDPFTDAEYVISTCAEMERIDMATGFLKQRLASSKDNFERGISALYLGMLNADEHPADATKYYEKAIKHFQKAEAPELFINDIRDAIEALKK